MDSILFPPIPKSKPRSKFIPQYITFQADKDNSKLQNLQIYEEVKLNQNWGLILGVTQCNGDLSFNLGISYRGIRMCLPYYEPQINSSSKALKSSIFALAVLGHVVIRETFYSARRFFVDWRKKLSNAERYKLRVLQKIEEDKVIEKGIQFLKPNDQWKQSIKFLCAKKSIFLKYREGKTDEQILTEVQQIDPNGHKASDFKIIDVTTCFVIHKYMEINLPEDKTKIPGFLLPFNTKPSECSIFRVYKDLESEEPQFYLHESSLLRADY